MLDVAQIKKDFPIFTNIPDLTYLDSTATSLKPLPVVEKLREYYEQYSANIFRGVYKISEKATIEYEETRKVVAEFIHANSPNEVIFTRNTTESLNLIAYTLGREIISQGDEIVTTVMEHHSNFVPWQTLALDNGAVFKVIDVDKEGYLDLGKKELEKSLKDIITPKTKLLTLTYLSNVLGTINPIKEIAMIVKKINPKIIIVVDAAQAAPHIPLDVQSLGVDFVAFSSHKMLGPTSVGVLWGKYELLVRMYPFLFGGEMIEEVSLDKTTFKLPPHKFEAGTPSIGEVIAFKEAINYLQSVGLANIHDHERKLTQYAIEQLNNTFKEKIHILGPSINQPRGGIVTFTFGASHPHDVAQILDEDEISIRAGHHCAMPLHTRYSLPASCRASFYLYNGEEDIDKLINSLKKVEKTLK